MKRRRAFTIVELVIVIAVIAILATVLIPTFSTIVRKAKDSYIMQNYRNELLEEYIESTLDKENYTPVEKKSESVPENRINELKTELTEFFTVIEETLYTFEGGEYTKVDVSEIDLINKLSLCPQYILVLESSGGCFCSYVYSYKEKYNIYFDVAKYDIIGSIRIRFYDDINTSSGESVYYGLKANKKGDETDENGNPKYEIEVIKYVEPQN